MNRINDINNIHSWIHIEYDLKFDIEGHALKVIGTVKHPISQIHVCNSNYHNLTKLLNHLIFPLYQSSYNKSMD